MTHVGLSIVPHPLTGAATTGLALSHGRAAAGILTALWSLGTAAGGSRTSPARARRATVGSDHRPVGELVG